MSSSCLVPPVADQSITEDVAEVVSGDVGGAFTAVRGGCGSLAECLDQVADHRSRQGLRYELGFLLAVVVAATACAGHDEVAAQAQWAADAPVWVLTALGARPDAQAFRVIRYVGDLDGQRRSKEVAHCITSLTTNKTNAPDLAQLLRKHWGAIENKPTGSATPPSTRTHPPSEPAPHRKRWRSSETP